MKNRFVPFICFLSFSYCFVNLYAVANLSDPAVISKLTALYYAGYLVSQPFGGNIADRRKARVVLPTCVLLCGISIILFAISSNIYMMLFFRFTSGLGCGPVMASAIRIIKSTSETDEKATKGMGLLLASPPVGILIASSLSPFLASLSNERTAMIEIGLFSVVIAVGAVMLPDVEAEKKSTCSIAASLRSFIGNRGQMIMAASGFCFMFAVVGFGTLGRGYLQSEGYSTSSADLTMSLFSLLAIVGSVSSGYISERIGFSNERMISTGLLLLFLVFAVVLLPIPVVLKTVLVIVSGFFSYLPSTHYMSVATKLAGSGYVASASSNLNFLMQLGPFVMPFITQQMLKKEDGYVHSMILFIVLLLVGFVFSVIGGMVNRHSGENGTGR